FRRLHLNFGKIFGQMLFVACFVCCIKQLSELMDDYATKSAVNLDLQAGYLLNRFSVSFCFEMYTALRNADLDKKRYSNWTLERWNEQSLNSTELIQLTETNEIKNKKLLENSKIFFYEDSKCIRLDIDLSANHQSQANLIFEQIQRKQIKVGFYEI